MISFPIPEGFQVPEGVQDGQEFDAVGTFVASNGSLSIKAVDDMPLKGESPESPEKEQSEQGSPIEENENFMSAVEKRMSGA